MVNKAVESFDPVLCARLVDNLYVEAMVLADEARAYFDGPGMEDRERLDVIQRLSFACESLKVTTRMMHVIAWLLNQKAWRRGEIDVEVLENDRHRLGEAAPSDEEAVGAMPMRAASLVRGSLSLYDRVWRLQERMHKAKRDPADGVAEERAPGPARALLDRLERSF
jgi:regulator of CtrA degradation